ncbi:D-glycero-beta-D-manno-heptose-7-phosphate kinase [Tistrella sp. BH-R2-4]|uniref:Bifunctional protein HldE n=1 Tax=Tistrella arctica TaxID=3133430 RepID=A0ABU9YS53_9PROT
MSTSSVRAAGAARVDFLDLDRRFGAVTVAVIGDVMLDRFVYGKVERISPEAPIPVLRVERRRTMIGGAGNAARNVASLGAHARLVAVVGPDAAAAELRDLLAAEDRITGDLAVDIDGGTIVKTRYVAQSQQLLRSDEDGPGGLSLTAHAGLMAAVAEAVAAADIVLLSDYGKGVLAPDILTDIMACCLAAGRPVVVDPKARDLSRYRGAMVLTPNAAELAVAAGEAIDPADDDAVTRAALALVRAHGFQHLVATRGAHGVTVVGADGSAVHLPARAREVFDVSGAGDTLVAALACGLAAGGSLVDAVQYANAAAGVVVGKLGTATVTPTEIRAAAAGDAEARSVAAGGAPRHARVVDSAAEAARITAGWQRDGLSVGVTNGCFDLLHRGHLDVIGKARAACDRLVVAVNADASVRRLKGPSRPVQDQDTRAAVLAALADVDLVLIFAEDTPAELIAAIRPDLLVKGGDYRPDTVVGADVVTARGGRVMIVPILPGHSTTATVARINQSSD